MNLLSGVTWKGARLRIGEAKPDFRERCVLTPSRQVLFFDFLSSSFRIQLENESLKRSATTSDAEPPKKRRRLPRGVQGVHAADMSLVTSENASSHPGWRITSLGRLIRPMRMRPGHPLPQTNLPTHTGKLKIQAPNKAKRKLRSPPSRARRRTIDPTKWGSQHLKGVFLDAEIAMSRQATISDAAPIQQQIPGAANIEEAESEESEHEEEPTSPSRVHSAVQTASSNSRTQTIAAPELPPTAPTSKIQREAWAENLDQEKKSALGLLQTLFGDKGDEWGDKESLDSDLEMDAGLDHANAEVLDVVNTEDLTQEQSQMDAEVGSPQAQQPSAASTAPSAPVHVTKLKDLFAPREEQGSFISIFVQH